ncbi:hypothetical protein OPKNFCMD_3008 [Methylobacterium crusticola]|uniref:Porin n=1 Tax=Methylobacterium crusticola TaxID=1697972 RepID=A0ABQ4QZI1_9HYPH|nr:hypothetical protein [Methylobacterium crusticola]GJD50270.1 hypothetical protein OPKNFCMD_3008 [Methylobacterium crusticola]
MINRLTVVAAAALLSCVATPLVVRAAGPGTPSRLAAPAAVTPAPAAAPAAQAAPCRSVRVVYAAYAGTACAR